MEVKELKDTIDLMTSSNYEDRFRAEYYQLNIRYNKLCAMCEKWDKGELNFTPTCPRGMYTVQMGLMATSLALLEERAELEKIEL